MALNPYLLKSRHGIFYFRKIVFIHPKNRRKEIRLSLKTRHKRTAVFLSSMLNMVVISQLTTRKSLKLSEYDELKTLLKNYICSVEEKDEKLVITGLKLFDGAKIDKAEISGSEDSKDFTQFITDTAEKLSSLERSRSINQTLSSTRLSEAQQAYINNLLAAEKVKPKTITSYEAKFRDFIEFSGDLELHEISEGLIIEYKNLLKQLPPNKNKLPEFKDLTLPEAAKKNTGKTLSDQTIRAHMNAISALLNYCIKRGWITYNPAATLIPKKREKDGQARVSFTSEDINALYLNEFMSELRNDMSTYSYYLPMLALYTGARLNELCSLRVEDVFIENTEIPCIRITEYKDRITGIQYTTKNNNSKRYIPLHPDLKRIGFFKYIKTLKKLNVYRVFPELTNTRDGLGQAASKWFSRFKKVFLTGEDCNVKTFHSFRHTFINHLLNNDTPIHILEQLTGHRKQSNSVIERHYRDLKEIKDLYESIKSINYNLDERIFFNFKDLSNDLCKEAKKRLSD